MTEISLLAFVQAELMIWLSINMAVALYTLWRNAAQWQLAWVKHGPLGFVIVLTMALWTAAPVFVLAKLWSFIHSRISKNKSDTPKSDKTKEASPNETSL